MIKKFFLISLIFLEFFSFFKITNAKEKVILFWGQGCPHCAKVESFIQKNKLDNYFEVERKEVYFNQENRDEFMKVCEEHNIPLEERGVPMAVIKGECIIGDKLIIEKLEEEISTITKKEEDLRSEDKDLNQLSSFRLTFPLVVGAASVDAVNPCAFAVLIILIATVLTSGSRKRALLSGLAFSLAIYISYLLMGLGVYKALASVKFSHWFMIIVGSLAIILGILNIKDYFWYGKGLLMEVPLSWRPKLKTIIRSVTSPLSAFLVGILVSLFLLPCTSGPYIVILGMLSQKETFKAALGWLLLYNFIFILPMIIITICCYFGLNPEKLEKQREKRLRSLHLIAGVIMLIMGVVILLKVV